MKFTVNKTIFIVIINLVTFFGHSQFNEADYEDYSAFRSAPVDLDQEYRELFERFFQSSLSVGTSIFTGGLGEAYGAGLMARLMFTFYFDREWAVELGAAFAAHSGRYDTLVTGTAIDFDVEQFYIPVFLGARYGFNKSQLTRGLATMNPYVSAQGEIIFRTETTGAFFAGGPGAFAGGINSRFDELDEKTSDIGFGFNIGAGIEFDIYKQILYLGFEAKYHMIFWPDQNDPVGDINRNGGFITILVSGTYNY